MIGFIERLILGPIKAKTFLSKRTLEPLQPFKMIQKTDNQVLIMRGKHDPNLYSLKEKIVKVVGGMDHFLLLTETGKLYTLGSNEHGQLATDITKHTTLWSSLRPDDDSEEIYDEPQLINTMDGEEECKIIDIAAGHFSSFAVTDGNRLYSWGAGILGTGDEYFDTRPQRISIKGIVSVQAWRDLILAKTGKNEKYIFGATLESGKKILKPTLCTLDQLPDSTDEYPDIPIHYFSHHVSEVSTFTIPQSACTSRSKGVYKNYNYAIYY